MASGTIYGTTSNSYIDSCISWWSTPNTATNSSSITAALYYKRNNVGYTTKGNWSGSINIGGHVFNGSKSITITNVEWTEVLRATVDIGHYADGSLSISLSGSGGISGTSLKATYVSGTATMDYIARESVLESAADVTVGDPCIIKWTPNSSSFWFRIKFEIGGWSEYTEPIHPGTTSQYTYTGYSLPMSVLNLFTGPSVSVRAALYTYSDPGCTNLIGGWAKNFNAKAPYTDETKPTISITSLSPVHSLPAVFENMYLQGKSKVKAVVDAKAQSGANVSKVSLFVGGLEYNGLTSDFISSFGDTDVTVRVTDSRGFTADASEKIYVNAYSSPKPIPYTGIENIVCSRCDSAGEFDEAGTNIRIMAGISYSKIGEGLNNRELRFRYKVAASSAYGPWRTIIAKSDKNDIVDTGAIALGLPVSSAFDFQIGAVDTVGSTSEVVISVPTDKVILHKRRNALGIGKYTTKENAVDSDWVIHAPAMYINGKPVAAFVEEIGESGTLTYKKWSDGTVEFFGYVYAKKVPSNPYVAYAYIQLPFELRTTTTIIGTLNNAGGNTADSLANNVKIEFGNPISVWVHSYSGSIDGADSYTVSVYIVGKI